MRRKTYPGILAVLGTAVLVSTGAAKAQDNPFELYGQLNLGILNYDDGAQNDSFFVNNSNSTSRIGFNYAFPTSTGDLKFNFETALGIVSSSSVDLVNGAGDFIDFDKTSLRKFELIYETDNVGAFSIGQGSMATDGSAEADYSGTSVVTKPAISDLAGGNFLRDTGGTVTGFRVRDTNSDFDGVRRLRLRYDTPSYSGLRFAVAYGREVLRDNDDNKYYDIALTNAAKVGNVETNASLGYSWLGDDRKQLVGSIALLHTPTGVNGALATGNEDDGGSYYWIKAGIRRDWSPIGETALSFDYYDGSDFVSKGSETDSWALAVVQGIDAASLEAFLVYREYGFKENTATYLDGRAVMVGSRWRF